MNISEYEVGSTDQGLGALLITDLADLDRSAAIPLRRHTVDARIAWSDGSEDDSASTLATEPVSTIHAQLEAMGDEACTEILNYSALTSGWDGYFGKEFDPDLITCGILLVIRIVRLFADYELVPDSITPGPAADGSIGVDVEFCDRTLMFTLEPSSPGYLSVGCTGEGMDDIETKARLSWRLVDAWARWLVSPLGGAPVVASA